MTGTRRYLPAFPEEWLCRVWGDRELVREPLRTIDGRSVRILDPGTPNSADGPDFLAATLEVDQTPRRGDVEFHFRTDEWYAHHHDRDARFANVLLHVVLDHTTFELCVRHRDAGRIPVVELRKHLSLPIGALAARVQRPAETSPCPLARDRPSAPDVDARLRELGEVRLLERVERFQDRNAALGAEQCLYEALADALGYSRNRAPFARLVKRVPFEALCGLESTAAEALLLGAAGLLPSQRPDGAHCVASDAEPQALEEAWSARPVRPAPIDASDWHFSHLRQGNSPTRRVLALARIVTSMGAQPFASTEAVASEGSPDSGWQKRWGVFQVPSGSYWDRHADFGKETARSTKWLVGKSRAGDIWVNVALPALVARAMDTGDEDMRDRGLALYRAHPPLQSNHKTRWVAQHVLRADPGADRSMQARLQQGILALYGTHCEPRRCNECPLRRGPSTGKLAITA